MNNSNYEFPKAWVNIKLGQFVESEKGKKPKRQAIEKSAEFKFPYIDIEAFEQGKVKSWTDGEGCRFCYESDFLMVWDGSRSGLVGKGMHGALGSTLVRISFPGMLNQYAYYFLLSKYQEINTRAKGSGTPHVDPNLLWSYDFPVAPLNEQKRIVAKIEELFSELDNGIATLKTAHDQLKVYRQTVLKHAFEGKLTAKWRAENADKLESPEQLLARIHQEREARYQEQFEAWKTAMRVWEVSGKEGIKPSKPIKPKRFDTLSPNEISELGSIPREWSWIRTGDIALVGTGITPLRSNSEFHTSGNIAWVTSGALNDTYVREASSYITEKALNETNLRLYPKHTLVLALYGEGKTRGKCSELLIQATINQAVAAIMLEGIPSGLRKFVKWHLTKNYEEMRLLASGGVQPNLNLGIIENMTLPLCSLLEANELSSQLDEKFSVIDDLSSSIDRQLMKAESIRQSILKKAFSGQLVPQDPNDEPASELLARIQAEKDLVQLTAKQKPKKTSTIKRARKGKATANG